MIPCIQHEDMYAGYWDVVIMVRFLTSVQRFDSVISEVWMNCIMKTSKFIIFEYQAELQDN